MAGDNTAGTQPEKKGDKTQSAVKDKAATTASQQQTQVGDGSALQVARNSHAGTGSDGALPNVLIIDGKPPQTSTAADTPPAVGAGGQPASDQSSQPREQNKPRAISDDAAKEAAKELHDAAFNKTLWGHGWSDPDKSKIINVLEPQSAADRQAIEDAYKKQYGHDLRSDLKQQLGVGSDDWSHVEAILNRKDGASDDAGQMHTALTILDNASGRESGRGSFLNIATDVLVPVKGAMDLVGNSEDDQKRALAEADLRKTLGSMTAQQLNDARQAYKANYGKDLDQTLLNDKNLSQGTKEALKILLQGTEARTGNSPEAVQNTLKLADIALKYKNSDLFDQAMANACPEARQQFLANDGTKKIDQAFSGDDRDKAHSYVERGEANIAMFVEGDSHWYHTNKDEITRMMKNASDEDRQQYQRGMDLVNSHQQPTSDADKQAVDFYNRLHKALKGASGSDRELADWESKLLKQESVITNVLESHNDGTAILWGHLGGGTDRNKLFGAVENLSQDDWQRFKQHPADLQELDQALKTFASDDERKQIMQMMQDKLTAASYDASKSVGRRSIDQLLRDNKDNTGAQLDALMHMSPQEQAAYKQNPQKLDQFASQLPDGVQRYEAQRILQEAKAGKRPDKVDSVLVDAVKSDDPAQTVRDIQDAFKSDPTLRDRISNPQTEDDKKLAQFFHDAATAAMMKGLYGDVAQYSAGEGDGGYAYSEYMKEAQKSAQPLFQTGRLPLDQMVQLDKDQQSRYADILNAGDEDKKRLLENPPHDQATRDFQDKVFGSVSAKEMLQYALQQGKMDKADIFRSYVLGSETTPEQLQGILDKMTADQKQDLANEYYTKYHTLISTDVINKVPNEDKFRFREELSPTEVNVRQISLDARADLYNHTSAFDGIMNASWDKSKQAAIESTDNVNKFVTDHAAEINNLPPEQRQQFLQAIQNYQDSVKNYVNSKGQFAEMVVDSAITVAAIGGAAFTGGGSLALLAAVGAGTAGAMFRVGAMRAIEGGDFDGSAKNIEEQAFKGFTAAALGFIGPEALGINGLAPIGEGVAAASAESALTKAAEAGLENSAFGVSQDAAEQTLKDGIEQLSRQGVLAGKQETQDQIAALATKVLGDGASAEQKQILETSIKDAVQKSLTKDLTQKVINESEALLMNMATGAAANSATEVGATVLGFESPSTLLQRIESSAISGAVGAGMFHVGFKAVGAGWRGLSAVVGRDAEGPFVGKGTWMERTGPNGEKERFQVSEDRYRPKQGENIVEQVKQGDPLYDVPPKRPDNVGADGRPLDAGYRDRIREEFKPMTDEQFRQSRNEVINDLKNKKVATGPTGESESVFDRLMGNKTMTDAQKQQVVDMLAEVREHYMGLNVNGKVLSDQEVNWIHTQGELSRVLESAAANKLSGQETTDALIASMFSDSAKYGQSEITTNNFWTHHLDGALAAQEVLARHGFPQERIDSIVQAIREHQIAPPEFMGVLYRMRISGALDGQIKAEQQLIAEGKGDQAKLDHLNHLKQVLNDTGPDGMAYHTADGKPAIRQIADITNQPLVKNGNGEWEVGLTPDQRELLSLAGTDHWYVPHDPTADPEFSNLPKEQQQKLVSEYKIARALIDGDGIDNYATINGASKIVKIRGPGTFFSDGTVWDSVRSVDTSYQDAYKVLTPEGQKIAQARLAEKNRELFGHDGKFQNYGDHPPSERDHSAEAEMYRWLVAQGKDPRDGIPFYNEPLKYPKQTMFDPETTQRISQLREQATSGSPEQRAQADSQLQQLSGLNAKQWHDYDFAKQIRDHMTDVLRGQARMDGQPPGDFASVRSDKPDPLAQYKQFAKPDYQPLSENPQKTAIPQGDGEVLDLGDGWTAQPWHSDKGDGFITKEPDGSVTVSDRQNGWSTKYSADGKVVSATNGATTREFGYDTSGELNQVKFSPYQNITREGDQWVMHTTNADGSVTDSEWFRGKIVADGDGTVRYLGNGWSHEVALDNTGIYNTYLGTREVTAGDGTKTTYYSDGTRTIDSPDGERTTFRSDGRTDYEKASYSKETAELHQREAQVFTDPDRQRRFDHLINQFETQANARGLSENDKALLYKQVNRLLADGTAASGLTVAQRADLAELILLHAAHPETVDQGAHPTCNVTTIEHRLYYKHPDQVAQIIADQALTGEYVTTSGQHIKLPGGIEPDAQARKSLSQQQDGNQIPRLDGKRDWATQIVNDTLVDARWSGEQDVIIKNGDTLIRGDSPLGFDASGRLLGELDRSKLTTEYFDDKGEPITSWVTGKQVYDSQGHEVTLDQSKWVYDQNGRLLGQEADGKAVTTLYDHLGKPLNKLLPGEDAYDANGKLMYSRVKAGEIKFTEQTPGDPFGAERLYYEHDGKRVRLKDSITGKMEDGPAVPVNELDRVYREVTGSREPPFVIEQGKMAKRWSNLIDVSTPDELGKELELMQKEGNLPAVILVHTSGPYMDGGVMSSLGLGGGWHVINVDGYDPGTKTVKFTNQWGSAYDHLDKGVPLDSIFKMMRPSSPRLRKIWNKMGVGNR